MSELSSAVLGDYLTLVDDSCVAVLPHALRLAAEFGIGDALADGPLSTAELAERVGAHPEALYRLMRALASVRLVWESTDATFHLTAAGQRLCSRHPSSAWACVVNADSQRAWLRAGDTVRDNRSVFGDSSGGEFFAHKDHDPEANRLFLRRMRERVSRTYPRFASVVDWRDSRVVMDIGGGDGYVLGTVLDTAPHVEGVLFDRPAVIDVVRPADRMRLVAGDFFRAVPEGADTHLLCSVLHDWTDEQARTILARSRAALRPGGRLHIVEMLVPPGNDWHPSKWSDLGMMVLTGGRERTRAEFADLLTDAGWAVESVRALPESHFSVITAR
ncbi:methyltransferase [Couchioplanes azureus]|uniref:methyltransferase n=1 Tax=Couchioplanes caeruleus TaxID=56438 RepID=UPI0016713C06|nr:methyltransferase [Couchioplanes caeruleus]GGQ87544.1 methyltransferase [Couchioplanes caeruleus subsp. azureus]